MAFGMPLALLGLHRYLGPAKGGPNDDPAVGAGFSRPGALALFGVGWLITALSNAYMLLFFPLLALCWCVWFLRPREWRRLVPLAVTAVSSRLRSPLRGLSLAAGGVRFSRSIPEIRAFMPTWGACGVSHR